MTNFPVTSERIKIKFQCPQCEADIVYEITNIPHPNMGAKNVAESTMHRDDEVIACNCNNEFIIQVYRDMYEGGVNVLHNGNELEVSILG